MGPTIVVGSAKAQGSKAKPKASGVRDNVTQRMDNILAHLVPYRGDPASSRFVSESRLGGFLHAPL
jgi:hypothetical protein